MSAHLIELHSTWYKTPTDDSLSALLAAVRAAALTSYAHEFQDQAQDMAQTVTMRVWQNLGTFTPYTVDAFPRWLKVIIKNERQHHFDDKQPPTTDGPVETAPEENQHLDISSLPETIKPAAELILAGHTIREAAQLLDIKECTLRKRFAVCKKNH